MKPPIVRKVCLSAKTRNIWRHIIQRSPMTKPVTLSKLGVWRLLLELQAAKERTR